MTRFARAKGSKASNERVPEEATSWSEMKQQLLEKNKEVEETKKRKDAEAKRNANYKAFLEEKDNESTKNSQWADFPESATSTKKKGIKKISKLSINNKDSEQDTTDQNFNSAVEKNVKKKKCKATLEQNDQTEDSNKNQVESSKPSRKRKSAEDLEGIKKKAKKDFPNKINGAKKTQKLDSKQNQKINVKGNQNKVVKENLSDEDLKRIQKKKQKKSKQLEKRKKYKAELKLQNGEEDKVQAIDEPNKHENTDQQIKSFDKSSNNNVYPTKPFTKSNKFTQKKAKPRDNENHHRKKPLLPHKMFINGRELEVDYVDGFPVKKEDAARLKKLRKEMISKGLPRSEINIALKLERRKAEKVFAREKKKVCFHCRMSGHNLSECPSLDKNEVAQTTATGICFKCGSTEHTHFECKVVRGQEFKYATCFICKEQGHIARQCPDNARGLYPKGGACKVCGDVTHLKKDCPKYQAQQKEEENNLRIETIGSSNPDVLDDNTSDRTGILGSKRPNKIIKF